MCLVRVDSEVCQTLMSSLYTHVHGYLAHFALVPQLHLASPYLCRCGFAVYVLQLLFPPVHRHRDIGRPDQATVWGAQAEKYLGALRR